MIRAFRQYVTDGSLRHRSALAACLLLTTVGPLVTARPGSATPPAGKQLAFPAYPYRSAAFSKFIEDSYPEQPSAGPQRFYNWFETAYERSGLTPPDQPAAKLVPALEAAGRRIQGASDAGARTAITLKFAGWLHGTVKRVIPKFSLDRGFEFRNVVEYGERQCFLQAVLIAGLLQRAGLEAGVVMVWKNHHGVETNNGHAVTLLSLADGTQIIVDASEPEPFPRIQGLFVDANGYRYVSPEFRDRSGVITGYRSAGTGVSLPAARVGTLNHDFLRSQFYFYRGERVPDGLLAARPTSTGLEASARLMKQSVRWCPDNPLAVYSLGRVYLKQSKPAEARAQIQAAVSLYRRDGWVPPGPRDLLAHTRATTGTAPKPKPKPKGVTAAQASGVR